MPAKVIRFDVPPGTTMSLWADGKYHLMFDEAKVLDVRNFLADLTNKATFEAQQYLGQRKAAIDAARKEKINRAIPASESDTITEQLETLGAGTLDVLTEAQLTPEVPEVPSVPETEKTVEVSN